MKLTGFLLVLVALAACGADGEPIRPTVSTSISVGTNGVNAGTSVSASSGPVSVSVGL
jgi:hypothetical protein